MVRERGSDRTGVGIVPALREKPAQQNLEMMGVHLRPGLLAPAVKIGGGKHELRPQAVKFAVFAMTEAIAIIGMIVWLIIGEVLHRLANRTG
jgi:hypothetical protein